MPVNQAESDFFQQVLAVAEPDATPVAEMTIDEFRAGSDVFLQYTGPAADITTHDRTIPCPAGHELKTRVYTYTDEAAPFIIFFPGCGFVLDLFEPNHIGLSRLCKAAKCNAALVQFRLCPETPMLDVIQDGVDAVKYITSHCEEFKTDPNRIVVGGFSSGGCLAASVCNQLRHSHNIYHQLLLDGCYDQANTVDAFKQYDQQDLLCNADAIDYIFNTCCPDNDLKTNPLCSPYWEQDLSGLPNTTVIIPEYSGVRSHGEAYSDKLIAAGNKVNKIIIPGQTHNTFICRGIMNAGDDPAVVAGQAVADSLR